MPVKPIPDGYHTITSFLLVKDAASLMDFLKNAFGATERFRHQLPDGKIMHAEMRLGDSNVMMGEANDRWPPMPCMLYVYVEDVDGVYKQAMGAGGKSLREPTTEFYGDRTAGIMDPAGNQWWIATHVEDVSEEELKKRQAKMAEQSAAK